MIIRRMGMMLRPALKEEGLIQKEFAAAVGVSEKHLSHVLTGKACAKSDRLDSWAASLGRRWLVMLIPTGPAWRTYWSGQPPERVLDALIATLHEQHLTEEALAEGLGYTRSEGGPDDPNGGGHVTGDHTAMSLACEARERLLGDEKAADQ